MGLESGLPEDVHRCFNNLIHRKPNGCWRWTAACDGNGNPIFNRTTSKGEYQRVLTRVYVWELTRGERVRADDLFSTCDDSLCVNPDHLVTHGIKRQQQMFLAKTRKKRGTSCLLWNGSRSDKGAGLWYGSNKQRRVAHVWAWILWKGEAPSTEFHVVRTCEEPDCVNPDHLKLHRREGNRSNLTPNVEQQDTCNRGHPWTPENTYYFRDTRQCRKCNSIRVSAKIKEKFNKQCIRGHIRTPENTRVGPTGRKTCLDCERQRLK